MAGESPADLERLNTAFVNAVQYINPIIADRSKEYKNIYRSMISRGSFPYGQGYVLQNQTFYGGTHIQDAGASWDLVESSRPPNPTTGDPGHDACKYESEIIGYGFETKQYQLYQATRRTFDICLTDIMFKWQFEKQLALVYQMLSSVTMGEWEQIMRELYISFCTKYLVSNSATGLGLDTFALTMFDDEIAIPSGGFGDVGVLTQEILDRLYQYLYRQAPDASTGMMNGMPQYGLVTSAETSKEIVRNDTDRRHDFHYAQPNFNIEGYGSTLAYQGFAHIHDPHAPRFKVSAIGDKLERVYPYETTPTTIGDAVNVAEDYIKAPFELSVLFLKDVYQALVPPSNPARVAGGYEFDPADNFGDFHWINIQDRDNNILREKGFFFARFRVAGEPLAFSNDAICLLHRRCQQLPVDLCDTQDDGVGTAVNVVSCAQHNAADATDDATEFDIVLAGAVNNGVGQQLTITFTGSLTANVIIADEGSAPQYTVVFAAGTSGGWCAYDSGMATAISS